MRGKMSLAGRATRATRGREIYFHARRKNLCAASGPKSFGAPTRNFYRSTNPRSKNELRTFMVNADKSVSGSLREV